MRSPSQEVLLWGSSVSRSQGSPEAPPDSWPTVSSGAPCCVWPKVAWSGRVGLDVGQGRQGPCSFLCDLPSCPTGRAGTCA